MRIALAMLVVACGSSEPVRITAKGQARRKPTPVPITCGDIGVILRGKVENAKEAGPAKEAAIASECLHGKWSREVIECVATKLAPQTCIELLAPAQVASLDKMLFAWADAHGETHDAFGTPEVVKATDCANGIGDVYLYEPNVANLTGVEERGFTAELRRSTIDALCRSGWPEPVKLCFAAGEPSDTCRKRLPADMQRVLVDQLAVIDQAVARAVAARAKPAATYDCKKVVAAHYSDAAWNAAYPPPRDPKAIAERKRIIGDARTQMLAACTNDQWSSTMRACIVAGVGNACFRAIGVNPDRWGFAPVPASFGVPECDSYAARMIAYQNCGQIAQVVRDRMQQMFEAQAQQWRNAPLDQRQRLAPDCRAADETLKRSARSSGCTI